MEKTSTNNLPEPARDPQPAYRAVLQPANQPFPAPADQPLLRAAEQAGLALASSCRNGTCRTCMVQMTGGQVRYHVEWPGLSAEEKAEGWVLPCVAHPVSDLVLWQAKPPVF